MSRITGFLLAALAGTNVYAQTDSNVASEAEAVDVDAIKKKYWATGDESQLGVVQNRLYSKSHKFQLGLAGGVAFSDPFLSLRTLGGSVGYSFTETWSVSVYGWKTFASPSSALAALRASGKEANTVLPSSFYGVDAVASVLYGKLSLVGRRIIYYDLFVTAGAGLTNTENGAEQTASLGLGQRFYVTQNFSLRADYHLQYYSETVKEKVITTSLGQVKGTRANFTHSLQVGVDVLFGI